MLKSFKFILTLPSSTRKEMHYAGVTLKAFNKSEAIRRFKAMVDEEGHTASFAVEEERH